MTKQHKIPLKGRYELRKLLGVGGMAQVFLGWDLLLQREVAIKMLRPEHVKNPYEVSRFLIEGQLLARVDSDRVVQIFDMHSDDDECYLVLQRLVGETLEQNVTRRGAFSSVEACEITCDVLSGLAMLHARGVIHRDIKPTNVLVGEDLRAILLDLGVASDQTSPGFTQLHATVGTPGYMSPEQRASGYVDQRSDLYQVGMVMLYALTGENLMEANHDFSEALALVPSNLGHVVARALAEDAAMRFQTADEMIEEVQRASNMSETRPIRKFDSASIVAFQAPRTLPPTPPPSGRTFSGSRSPSSPKTTIPPPIAMSKSRFPKMAAMAAGLTALVLASMTMLAPSDSTAASIPDIAAPSTLAASTRVAAAASESAPPPPIAAAEPAPAPALAPAPARVAVAQPVRAPEPEPERVAIAPKPPERRAPDPVAASSRDIGAAFANAATGKPTSPLDQPVTRPAPAPTPAYTAPSSDPLLAQARLNEQNGATEMAIAQYRRYLREHPDAPDATRIRTRLTTLESGRTVR